MTIAEILSLLWNLDKLLDLGGKLIAIACQCEPRLRTEPLPDEGDAMKTARAKALKRSGGK